MKRTTIILASLIFLLLASVGATLAQSGGGFDLSWSTVDSGGGQSSGGGYTLSGTIGQPEVGLIGGGGYALAGGFWPESVSGSSGGGQNVYLPIILRNK